MTSAAVAILHFCRILTLATNVSLARGKPRLAHQVSIDRPPRRCGRRRCPDDERLSALAVIFRSTPGVMRRSCCVLSRLYRIAYAARPVHCRRDPCCGLAVGRSLRRVPPCAAACWMRCDLSKSRRYDSARWQFVHGNRFFHDIDRAQFHRIHRDFGVRKPLIRMKGAALAPLTLRIMSVPAISGSCRSIRRRSNGRDAAIVTASAPHPAVST